MNSATKSAVDMLEASAAARDVFRQLFMAGPTWDGDVASKAGRDALTTAGLAFRVEGWTTLTPLGMNVGIRDLGMGDAKDARERTRAAERQARDRQEAVVLGALSAIVKNAEGGAITIPIADLSVRGACAMEPAGDTVVFRYRELDAVAEAVA